jgi:hypothetical protein
MSTDVLQPKDCSVDSDVIETMLSSRMEQLPLCIMALENKP